MGSTALTYQVGGSVAGGSFVLQRTVITQFGNDNFASLMQMGPNVSRIKQVGDDNSATVVQTYVSPGDPNLAHIKQIGNAFTASITQTGASNNAGVY